MHAIVIVRNPFLNEVHTRTLSAINGLLGQSAPSNLYEQLAIPPEINLGHATIATHFLAKLMRMPPAKIGEKIVGAIQSDLEKNPSKWIEKIVPVNGYINFFANLNSYGEWLMNATRDGSLWKGPWLEKDQIEKVSVEYGGLNTHKAIHIGHLRNLIFGESVSKLIESVGHQVVRTNYPGDMGAHLAKLMWYIGKYKNAKLPSENADWLGEMYVEADNKVESFKGTPQESEIKAEIAKVLLDLEEARGDLYPLYLETRKWSLNQLNRVFAWLGVHFDKWFFESECDGPSRALVQKKYKEGFFKESQGAIGIDLSEYNLGFALFLRGNGTGLYLTKDLELIRRKFEDPEVTRSIVVVDSRQRLHFQQLFKTAELMGYPQAAKSLHLSYEFVATEDGGVFSSRSQNGMAIESLRATIENEIKQRYLNSYESDWSKEEINKTAEMIAIGAIKYGMLKTDANNVIRFVLDEWLRLDGDTGPYLQYCNARCLRILEKVDVSAAPKSMNFQHETEAALLLMLGRYSQFLLTAATEYRPSVLAGYLYDLSKSFNRFYKECPIKDGPPDVQYGRYELVRLTSSVLQQGLGILGIPAPQRM